MLPALRGPRGGGGGTPRPSATKLSSSRSSQLVHPTSHSRSEKGNTSGAGCGSHLPSVSAGETRRRSSFSRPHPRRRLRRVLPALVEVRARARRPMRQKIHPCIRRHPRDGRRRRAARPATASSSACPAARTRPRCSSALAELRDRGCLPSTGSMPSTSTTVSGRAAPRTPPPPRALRRLGVPFGAGPVSVAPGTSGGGPRARYRAFGALPLGWGRRASRRAHPDRPGGDRPHGASFAARGPGPRGSSPSRRVVRPLIDPRGRRASRISGGGFTWRDRPHQRDAALFAGLAAARLAGGRRARAAADGRAHGRRSRAGGRACARDAPATSSATRTACRSRRCSALGAAPGARGSSGGCGGLPGRGGGARSSQHGRRSSRSSGDRPGA